LYEPTLLFLLINRIIVIWIPHLITPMDFSIPGQRTGVPPSTPC
jgi:hypothetical protein